MNVMQNQKKNEGKFRKTRGFHQKLNFELKNETAKVNPERIINHRVLNEITKDVFGNTTTINSSSESHVIVALTEGRGHAQGEVGIAALDVNSPAVVLCQLSDNFQYTDTLNKIQIMNPAKILLPDTMFETLPLPRLVELIRESFGQISIIPVQRRHFNDKFGLAQISHLCSRMSTNIIQVIARKYYCLSAASALLGYLKSVNMMTFAKNCLKVDYQTKQGGMMIDAQTSARLELLYSLSSESTSMNKFSLFAILNNCETLIGQRHLRANILEPSCNIDFIRNRQEQIKVLIEKEDTMITLKTNLQNFRNVDQLMKISCIVPADDCERAIEVNIYMTLLLKGCLEAVKPLADSLQATISESFEELRQFMMLPIYGEIMEKINEVVQPDIHQNRLARKHFQHLYAVKAKVNETVDFLRQLYSENIDKIRDYVGDLTEQSRMPIKMIHSARLGYHLLLKNPNNHNIPADFEVIIRKGSNVYMTTPQLQALNDATSMIGTDIIRMSNSIVCELLIGIAREIDSIHHLIGMIIELDIVQSLAEVSIQENYCCPSFSRIMRIKDAYHPLLDLSRNKVHAVTNNVIATPQYNFYLISGPNMSGKTIYIKMIAIIQIMAQIGCFVPASNAQLRMTDKLFSRIGFQDNIEQNASSFTIELREMEYIYSNLTPNSLVIIDELCRSTNPQEGEIICWSFCEKLLNFIGVSDDDYFKFRKNEEPNDEDDEIGAKTNNSTSLQFQGSDIKLKNIARPFLFLTTHFASLTKLAEKHTNAINLHMRVVEKIVDDKPRLEFKYEVQSGPTTVKSYGLTLARCLRFPQSVIKRAEELVDQITDESLVEFMDETKQSITKNKQANEDHTMNASNAETVVEEYGTIEKDTIELYSHILLLMSTEKDETTLERVNFIGQQLRELIESMSPEFREQISSMSLSELLTVLNSSRSSNSTIA